MADHESLVNLNSSVSLNESVKCFSNDNINNLLNLHLELDNIVGSFFTRNELDRLSRDAGFVQRESKINGHLFFDLIVFHNESLKEQSLNDLTVLINENYDIQIKKQSLNERFNEHALAFLKTALQNMLQRQIECPSYFKNTDVGFNRILIKDSTCFQIDPSLAHLYPGSGGGGSKASVRIQFEYDFLSGVINDLSVNAFNHQDATDSRETIAMVKKGDLILRDLAYMSLDVLQMIKQIEAFYLCRPNTQVTVYELNDNEYVEVDFVEVKKFMKKHHIDCMEKEVYLGKNEKFKTRLIINLLPDQEYEKRIRKANKNNKKKSRSPLSQEYKARGALNLFITNATAKQLPTEKAWPLYRLRWQIELVFKIWKTICHIERVKKVKKHRLECYIFSKLILIAIGWKVLWHTAYHLLTKDGKALSFFKASKTLFRVKLGELRRILMLGKGNIDRFLDNFYQLSRSKHLLEKKKNSPRSLDILLSCLTIGAKCN